MEVKFHLILYSNKFNIHMFIIILTKGVVFY